MIRGLFRAQADAEALAELRNARLFKMYVAGIRRAYSKAMEDTLHCDPKDLPDRRAYARCLSELLEETTGEKP